MRRLINPKSLELEHGRLDADTIIWPAGVVASPAARWLNAEHDRAGRVKVGVDLAGCTPGVSLSCLALDRLLTRVE